MPIIVVYTQTEDENVADQMFKVIKKRQGNISFIKTVAKKIKVDKKNYIEEIGKEELLNETLNKCTKVLKGEMIDLMIKKISQDIKEDLFKNNKSNEKEILRELINDFVNEYKLVLKNGDFLNYIVNIFILKLKKFYGEDMNFTNKSQNLLIKSNFVGEIKKFISKNKEAISQIINPIAKEINKDFIDRQAKGEKNCEIKNIKNKRRLKGFEKTSKKFLKDNFNYKLETYIINYLIKEKYPQYLENFRTKIDIIVENLLKINNPESEDIKKHLEYCFLIKLKFC